MSGVIVILHLPNPARGLIGGRYRSKGPSTRKEEEKGMFKMMKIIYGKYTYLLKKFEY